jgi:hypothetical protein
MELAPRSVRKSELVREVNTRIHDVSSGQPGGTRELVCECGDPLCADTMRVTALAYARARETATRFLFSTAHTGETGLEVVETFDGCLVAELV